MNKKIFSIKSKIGTGDSQQVARATKKLKELKNLASNLESQSCSNIYEFEEGNKSLDCFQQTQSLTSMDSSEVPNDLSSRVAGLRKSFMPASLTKKALPKFAEDSDSYNPSRPPRRKDKINEDMSQNEAMAQDLKNIRQIQQDQRKSEEAEIVISTRSVSYIRNKFKDSEKEEDSVSDIISSRNKETESKVISDTKHEINNQLNIPFGQEKSISLAGNKSPVTTPKGSPVFSRKSMIKPTEDLSNKNHTSSKNNISNSPFKVFEANSAGAEKKNTSITGGKSPNVTPKSSPILMRKNISKPSSNEGNKNDKSLTNEVTTLRSKGLGVESSSDAKKRVSQQLNMLFGERKSIQIPGNKSSIVSPKNSPPKSATPLTRKSFTTYEIGNQDEQKHSNGNKKGSAKSDNSQISDIRGKFENPDPSHNEIPVLRKTRPTIRRTNDGTNKMDSKRISKDLDAIFSKRASVNSMSSGTSSARNSEVLNRLSTSSIMANQLAGDLQEKNRNSIGKDIISRNSLEFDPTLATIRDETVEERGNGVSSGINDFDLDSVVIESQKLSHLTNNRARKPNQKQRRKPTKFAKK